MKVLVIGGGGREHAIVHTLKKSPQVDHIWCAPGNGGIAQEAECVDIKATDIDGVVAFAKEHRPDLVMGRAGRPAGARHGGCARGRGDPRVRAAQKCGHHRRLPSRLPRS